MTFIFQSQLQSLTKTARDLQIRGFSEAIETFNDKFPNNNGSQEATLEIEAVYQNESSIPGPSSSRKRRRTVTQNDDRPGGSIEETACSTLDDILTNATEGYLDLDSVKIEPDEYNEEESWLIDSDSENQEASSDQKPAFQYFLPTNLEVSSKFGIE